MSIKSLEKFFQQRGAEPANDNIVVEIFPEGAAISTTHETKFFTKALEAKSYVDTYYAKMAELNNPHQTLIN